MAKVVGPWKPSPRTWLYVGGLFMAWMFGEYRNESSRIALREVSEELRLTQVLRAALEDLVDTQHSELHYLRVLSTQAIADSARCHSLGEGLDRCQCEAHCSITLAEVQNNHARELAFLNAQMAVADSHLAAWTDQRHEHCSGVERECSDALGACWARGYRAADREDRLRFELTACQDDRVLSEASCCDECY